MALNTARHKSILVKILKDIYTDTSLGSVLGFKGGTAAYLYHKLSRESLDLDFDLLDDTKEDHVFEKIEEIAKQYGKIKEECKKFDMLTEQVARLESEADAVKRNIRNHLPRGILMPVDKFQFLQYLGEQDKVLDEVEEALFWLSFRPRGIPQEVAQDIRHLTEAVTPPIEKLSDLVAMANEYFKSPSEKARKKVKSIIREVKKMHIHPKSFITFAYCFIF